MQTGLSEELFFRGFLTKRLVRKFGFQVGNGLQSLLFGMMHGAMFVSNYGILGAIFIILLTGIGMAAAIPFSYCTNEADIYSISKKTLM